VGEKNPLINFELIGGFGWMLYGGDNTEGDVDHTEMAEV
jgi:hypothetical protein